MATSIAQIPSIFLEADQRRQFLDWLASIPAPFSSKKRLLVAWAKFTGHDLSASDYSKASIPPIIEAANAQS